MAEDEDGVSEKNSPQSLNNEEQAQETEQNALQPDLGIEVAGHGDSENGVASPTESKRPSSKSTGATRKEENPFSFRHFLKRDLSLPGTSTYENTGARPKVYANTVQHSPTRVEGHAESRRDKVRALDTQAKENNACDNASCSNSVEIPLSVVDNSDSKNNFYSASNNSPYYHKPNLASEPLGMPSLPDFVQDHILVEQAYLNTNGPISVDLDNLPDFTFNTNFNAGSSSSLGRRNNSYGSNRGYDYEEYMGAVSASNDSGSGRNIPLDLPEGAEAAGPVPLDLPPHLSLDLTDSVNPSDRRNVSPRNTFPLDLPPNAGAESMRLPDFLPVHPGRTSPEPEHQDEQLQQIMSELERTRSELFTERSRRCRLEEEISRLRASESDLRARLRDCTQDRQYKGQLDAAVSTVENNFMDAAVRATEAESTIERLKKQIKKLKEELAASEAEVAGLRAGQRGAAAQLRRATRLADTSLRELLAGLGQLNTLSSTLDPT
ncbi:uncharacterized protein LOC114242269 [Bombyx mandarina]|uniref:Endosome-associated-trafficking regulator 1 n=1 Tax=Bombyx mandarina TaxID=7092 RepID=A0A6J2JHZ1_BOMMA|nr:uncharacterized protein LOC114242269 [Bombyx mandarina]